MKIGSIVIRCYGFDEMMAFWQEALHYAPGEPAEDGWVVLCEPGGKGPQNVSLERVAEPLGRIGMISRVHLDLYTTYQAGEVGRLIGLGGPGTHGNTARTTTSLCLKTPTATASAWFSSPRGLRRSSKAHTRPGFGPLGRASC